MSDVPRYSVSGLAFGRRRVMADAPLSREASTLLAGIRESISSPLPPDPRSRYDYADMKGADQVAIPFVKLSDRENSISASLDGSRTFLISLSRKARFAAVQPESSDPFLIVLMTRDYYRTIFGLKPRATVLFTVRELTADQTWADGDLERWALVNRHAARINAGISRGGYRARAGYPGDSQ